jgi:hypothetical protein
MISFEKRQMVAEGVAAQLDLASDGGLTLLRTSRNDEWVVT